MTVPSPYVQQPGLGAVTADNFNTFVQTVYNVAQLRAFTGVSNMLVYLLGTTSPGDGGQGFYYYNASSTATDNGSSVIVPYGNVQGAWLYVAKSSASGPTIQSYRKVLSGSTDFALTTDAVIVWESSTATAKSEVLPAASSVTTGTTMTVKDGYGNAQLYPITVSTISGTFDGQSSFVIAVNRAAISFVSDGVSLWSIV